MAEDPEPNDHRSLSKSNAQVRAYACKSCSRTFKRSEHLSRHERGHTQEKPFHCRFCQRRYARKDLVTRHEKSFHPHGDNLSARPALPDLTTTNTTRQSPFSPVGPSELFSWTPLLNQSPSQIPVPLHNLSEQGIGLPRSEDSSSALISPPLSNLTTLDPLSHTTALSSSLLVTDDYDVSTALADDLGANGPAIRSRNPAGSTAAESSDHWPPSTIMWNHVNQSTWGDSDTNMSNSADMARLETSEDYFDNLDLLSILPKNSMDMEAGFSTYLFSSGCSPTDQQGVSPNQMHRGQTSQIATSSKSDQLNNQSVHTDPAEKGTFSRMPSVVREVQTKMAIPIIDAETYASILTDAKRRLIGTELQETELLGALDMQKYLTAYFNCFHRHCPIIHVPTLDLKNSPSYLVFAICAIGAMYRLQRKTAKTVWQQANFMVEKLPMSSSSDGLTSSAIASVQCRLLLGMYAIFSGDMTERAISDAGYWSTEYRFRRVALASCPYNVTSISWDQWVLRETSKRLLYGMFIMSSLMTVTYDLSPAFSVTQDLDIEVLDEDSLWEATSRQQWETLKGLQAPQPRKTVRDAMSLLLYGKEQKGAAQQPIEWAAFATTMVFHAVNINMWYVMQCTQSFTSFAVEDSNNGVLKTSLSLQVETALARCYALLTADRSEREHTSDDAEGPLIFNCLALLRSAYVRVFTGAGNFNRMMLLSEDPTQVSLSVKAYVAGAQERTPFLTRAVGKAYGGLLTPIKAGYLLVRKTAALTWSVEHAVAAWDCALFVTKWIHAMEMQQRERPPIEEENRNLMNFRELLSEVDSKYEGIGSLAGEVARVWAGFLDDTWVWGITPRMGQVLRQLSDAFNKDWEREFPQGNPGGPISR